METVNTMDEKDAEIIINNLEERSFWNDEVEGMVVNVAEIEIVVTNYQRGNNHG